MPAVPLLRDIAYAAAAVLTSPLWGYRLLATGKWRTDWGARFGRVHAQVKSDPTRKTLLIHAVSVGEVNAIRQLVDRLAARHGDRLRIVIATTTDTGQQRARDLFAARFAVVRYPLDFTRSVRRFLDAVRPDAVALVELECWPTFVQECARRDVPAVVINGRLSERSFGRYRRVRFLVKGMFARLAHAAVQDRDYAERFIALGMDRDRVSVTGTMKWDTAVLADDVPGSEALAMAMGLDPNRPLVVIGSTGPGEERMLLDALAPLDDVQVMIAPRKPERFDEVAALMGEPVRRSRHPDLMELEPEGNRLFLLDTLGELAKAYALADVAIVGRTFVNLGGSDMIEPIALGKATIVGPHVANFSSQMRALLAAGGVRQLADAGELAAAVRELLDPAAAAEIARKGRAVVLAEQGATDRHAALIASVLDLL